jgi:uncharacterized phage protein gp47/JayE
VATQGPPFGVTPGGFVMPTLDQIVAGMQADVWNTIDPTIDLAPTTVEGKQLASNAAQCFTAWSLLEQAYNGYDRTQAEGAALDNLGDVVGIPREGESYTTVFCTLALDPTDAPYAAGSLIANVDGFSAQTYSNQQQVTADDITAGNATVLMQSTIIGQVPTVNAGTLTEITSPVTGWTAITNPLAQTTAGQNEETDQGYGPRQGEELASEGTCNPGATAAAIVELGANQPIPVVLTVRVVTNTTPYQQLVSGIILPPKSYCVVIYDGGTGWASGTLLTGLATVTTASPTVAFATAQTLKAGTLLSFSSQPGVIYTLAAAMVAATTGTLTSSYTGNSSTASATIPGAGWYGTGAGSIGQTIYDNMPTGITPIGLTALIVSDPILGNETVYFAIPVAKPLFISATVSLQPGAVWTQVQAAIELALIAAAIATTPSSGFPPPGQLSPGSPVIGSQLEAVIASVPGVLDVQALTFDFVSSPSNTAPLAVSAVNIATIASGNIVLTQGVGL